MQELDDPILVGGVGWMHSDAGAWLRSAPVGAGYIRISACHGQVLSPTTRPRAIYIPKPGRRSDRAICRNAAGAALQLDVRLWPIIPHAAVSAHR